MVDHRSFKGITALVTGASAGIGEAFAWELARRQAELILVSRSEDKLKALGAVLEEEFGVHTHVFASDLSRPGAARDLYGLVQSEGLRVDLLINNAGVGSYGRFENGPAEKDLAMVTLNVCSLAALTRLFLPAMLAAGKGGVINVASTAGLQPIPYLSLYAATKAFVIHFSEALWGETKDSGVRILCLCPGNTETEFHRAAGLGKRKVFWTAKALDVARYGLKVYSNSNKPTAIYGWINKILAQGYRIAPRQLVVKVVERIFHP